jgi:cyanophycinase-like exopeptidase
MEITRRPVAEANASFAIHNIRLFISFHGFASKKVELQQQQQQQQQPQP